MPAALLVAGVGVEQAPPPLQVPVSTMLPATVEAFVNVQPPEQLPSD
jgi:hypothetical protein